MMTTTDPHILIPTPVFPAHSLDNSTSRSNRLLGTCPCGQQPGQQWSSDSGFSEEKCEQCRSLDHECCCETEGLYQNDDTLRRINTDMCQLCSTTNRPNINNNNHIYENLSSVSSGKCSHSRKVLLKHPSSGEKLSGVGTSVDTAKESLSWSKESPHHSSDLDLEIIRSSNKQLVESGFYYEHLDMVEARRKLKKCAVGTFLVRDSSHKNYLYSVTTQTPRGVTSVRIEYQNGVFRLDCEQAAIPQMPAFDSVLKLVKYYIELSCDTERNQCVWLESSGRRDTPVVLKKPLLKASMSTGGLGVL